MSHVLWYCDNVYVQPFQLAQDFICTFKRDRFAVSAGQTILPGTIFPSTVGHIPIWHALQREAVIKGEVTAIKYKPSPLVQGGLEIPIAVTVKWDDKNAIDILRKKVEEVSYPLGEDDRYTDESKDILNLMMMRQPTLTET